MGPHTLVTRNRQVAPTVAAAPRPLPGARYSPGQTPNRRLPVIALRAAPAARPRDRVARLSHLRLRAGGHCHIPNAAGPRKPLRVVVAECACHNNAHGCA
jgi:hypothetical protein